MDATQDNKQKLHAYLELLFAGAPEGHDMADYQEALYADLCDRYDELIAAGMDGAAAYNKVLSGVGTPEELFGKAEEYAKKTAAPEPPPKTGEKTGTGQTPAHSPAESAAIRKKASLLMSLAVALYVLCPIPLVLFSLFGRDATDIVGVCLLLAMVAAGTFVTVYASSLRKEAGTQAAECTDAEKSGGEQKRRKGKSGIRRAVEGAISTLTLVVYFVLSFATGAWHITWLVFLIGVAVGNVVDAAFAIGEGRDDDED